MRKIIVSLNLVLLLNAVSCLATNHNVYVNGVIGVDSATCGSLAGPCKTIQQGIDRANHYDTIRIAEGTYVESLSLAKPVKDLTLQCGWAADFSSRPSTPGNTILQPQYSNRSILEIEVAIWTTTEITVEGCVFTGGMNGITVVNSGGSLTAVFKNNAITGNSNDGIFIQTLTNSNSTVMISENSSIATNKTGIEVYNSGVNAVTSLTLSRNHIHNNSDHGIHLRALNKGRITANSSNNIVTRNEWLHAVFLYAMHVDSQITATFTNDTITANNGNNGNGGGLEAHAQESADIVVNLYNCILWDNSSVTGATDLLAYAQPTPGFVASTAVTANYSDIGVIYEFPSGTYIEGQGNLSIDPRLKSDQHLLKNSPLIDAGQCGHYLLGNYIRVAPYIDIDGEKRPGSSEISGCDIGADEFIPFPWPMFLPAITHQ